MVSQYYSVVVASCFFYYQWPCSSLIVPTMKQRLLLVDFIGAWFLQNAQHKRI